MRGSFPVGEGPCVCHHAPLTHKYCHLAGHGVHVQNAVVAEALQVIDGDAVTGSVEHALLRMYCVGDSADCATLAWNVTLRSHPSGGSRGKQGCQARQGPFRIRHLFWQLDFQIADDDAREKEADSCDVKCVTKSRVQPAAKLAGPAPQHFPHRIPPPTSQHPSQET